jgi:hypothetical protein
VTDVSEFSFLIGVLFVQVTVKWHSWVSGINGYKRKKEGKKGGKKERKKEGKKERKIERMNE